MTVSPSASTEDRPLGRLDRWRGRRWIAPIVVLVALIVAGCSGDGSSDSGDDQGDGDSTFIPVDGSIQIAVTEEQKERIEEACEEGGGVPGLGCQDAVPSLVEPCLPQPGDYCLEIALDPGSTAGILTIYPAETDPDDCSGPPCFSTTVSHEVIEALEERVSGDGPTTEPTTPEGSTDPTTSTPTEESPSALASSPAAPSS